MLSYFHSNKRFIFFKDAIEADHKVISVTLRLLELLILHPLFMLKKDLHSNMDTISP